MGETGTLIEDDDSGVPFEVKFSDSDTSWFVAENVALAGPPENVEGELRQRPSRRSSFGAGEDESVDSDYDNDEDAFADLGLELLSGRLKLAKVYGQEEPPAAEDELEWETRYVVLYDTRKMCHFDGMQNGEPVGDRGVIDLENIQSVEKVLGVPTFVMKGYRKVYLFKLEPHNEVMMRTWIGAISVELSASPASELSEPTPQPDRGAAFRPSLRSASLRSLLGGGQKATQPPKAALGAPATASMASVLAQAKLMLRQGSTSVSSVFGGGEKLLPTGVPTSLSLCGELEHMAACQGTYLLAPQRTAHGKPVWKHATGDRWIAWASDGKWKVQEGVDVGVKDAGFMKLEDITASLPHQSTAVWEEVDGKGWQKAPSCKCFGDVPTSLSLCGELEHMAACLGTYLLAPQLTAHGKPVWKHATGDRWIAWASDGKWKVHFCEEHVGVNNIAFMQLQETRASLPHQSTAVWEERDGKEWLKAPSCKCFGDVPTSLSLCGELKHKTACLGIYLLAPQRTAQGKPVWKHEMEDKWIAWASTGKWMVQEGVDVGVNNANLMKLEDITASLPHQSNAVWEEYDGTAMQWVKAPTCKAENTLTVKSAEKAAAEAKANTEKAAAEVKANTEKAAAEVKANTEKAAAEAKAKAEKAAAQRAESAKPRATAEPAAEPAAELEGLKAGLFQLLYQWGLRSDAPAAGSAQPERRAVRSQLPESWDAEEYFAVPGVITEQMTQTVKSRVLSQFMPEGVQFQDFYPEVVISYASGRRSGRDCEGAGPGMYYAVGILGLLHQRGVRCFSGLHVPPGTDWEVFMLRLNSRRAQAKVLIVVLTAALFQSKPCLKEINAAIRKGIPVLPIRFEDKFPGYRDQWAKYTDEDSEVMVSRVQEHLGNVNSIPHPGTVLTVPDSMNSILGLVDKYLGIDRAYVSPGNHGDNSYEA